MKTRAIVLGCGLIGETMARDLATDEQFEVTVADISERNLSRLTDTPNVKTQVLDLGHAETLQTTIVDYDLILGALPSRFGFKALRTVIEAGKPFCDISFMPEDAMTLDSLAKEKGVTTVVDCGVSPGLSNLCVGHAVANLDRTDSAVIYVGGLPKKHDWPFHYKAPFAPSDVIEEYTRPARLVENGKIVEKPALSEVETIHFDQVGDLEAFNTDGLRSLLNTVKIPDMKEKTMRYPGHTELMRVFRETGLFDKTPILVGDVMVSPLSLTSKLLFPKWALDEGEEEFTIMRVIVEGEKEGQKVRHVYDLYDEYDRETKTRSMARTTAYPCTIIARMVASGSFAQRGVIPLELAVNQQGFYENLTQALDKHGVNLQHKVTHTP